MVQRFSTHPRHTGAGITRGLFASSSGTDLDGGWGTKPSPRRCDAMPMRHAGATRYFAFYGVHSGIGTGLSTFWIFVFVFSLVGFSFSCLSVLFVPIWANQKRARTSITCIHHHHHHHTGKGLGGAGEGRSNLCLFLVIWGNIRGLFPLLRAGFLYSQPCCCVFYNLRYQKTPPVHSSPADPHPRAPEAPGSISLPPSSLLVKHAAGHAGTREKERVVFSSEWFGRDGGAGVLMGGV